MASPQSLLAKTGAERNVWLSIDGVIDVTAHALFIRFRAVDGPKNYIECAVKRGTIIS